VNSASKPCILVIEFITLGNEIMMKKFKHKLVKPLATVVDILMLGLLYLTRGLAYVLPVPFTYAIFTWLGYALYYIWPGARQRLFNVISECMPELSDSEVRHIARSSYGELLRPMVDFPVFARHGKRIMEKMETVGTENFDELDALGKGVIIVTPHVGGWDVATAVMTHHGYELTPVLVNPISTFTPRAVRAVEALGVSLGTDRVLTHVIPGGDLISQVTEHLKKGGRLGLTPDVAGKRVVEYFGRPAALTDGTGHFAFDTGAAITHGYVMRDKWGVPCRGVIHKQIRYDLTGDRETDVTNIMQAIMSACEAEIRKIPDQYTQWGAIRVWWQKAEELQGSDDVIR
jgi:lauroyl/myristoyl acyltransferase